MPRSAADPLLLTPGPVSVSQTTRLAMMVDRPSGDVEFQADLALARHYLAGLTGDAAAYTAIPLPGSATYANEGVIASFVPAGGRLLVHSNGIYGDRLVEICQHLGVPHGVARTPPFVPPDAAAIEQALIADPSITHVMMVHCETSTGMLNPIEPVAAACRRQHRGLLVDAVASYGAVPIEATRLGILALTVSSNKCMQGVPGIGWAVVQKAALESTKGRCRSLALDLWDHNQHMDRTGLFRFTPPTHVVAAFAQACREHAAEGGVPARLARYQANWQRLVDGMRQMGFVAVVPDAYASPIVATFREPDHPGFTFKALFEGMKRRGFVIFPGRLAMAGTFRIGCMGALTAADIGEAMEALADTMAAMGVTAFGRAEAVPA
jgi:2-aminoethylphosphonate-pyruvate transaminase